MTQLAELARPFPKNYIQRNPSGGGEYVKHSTVNERLLEVITSGDYKWKRVEVIRGYVPEIKPKPNAKTTDSKRAQFGAPALEDAVVGYIGNLVIEVDGRVFDVEETGDCEDPQNWPHDGARLKDASSDSFKRCCMRISLGLHLWSQQDFFLFDHLSSNGQTSSGPAPDSSAPHGTGAGPTPEAHQVNLRRLVAQANARGLTSDQKIQFRAELLKAGLPQSITDMDESQAADALIVLDHTFPEETMA